MSAELGTTSYTSVVWTAGDTITEAKLDNMVANDQAYDSHAAQGLLLNNNKSFAGKNSGGSNLNIAKVNTSDEIEVGEEGVGDHTVINAGSNKLVKIKVLRQDDTTDSYKNNSIILTGWGAKEGDDSTRVEDSVSFGITFDAAPIVIIGTLAISYEPTNITDVSRNFATGYNAGADDISTTGFTAQYHADADMSAGSHWACYSWIAIGELA